MIAFAHPGMLGALALVAVPIWLHRRRPAPLPVVPFAATRLLEKTARRFQRRARFQEWLLLAVRILLLAALAFAFAGPDFSRAARRAPAATAGVRIVAGGASLRTLEAALPSSPYLDPAGRRTLVFAEEPTETGAVTVDPGPYFHPALAVFDDPAHGDLGSVRVWRWRKLVPVGRAIVLARLSNGDPFLVEDGNTISCAVAPDLKWTDLPLHPNFVPLVHELVKYLATTPAVTGGSRPRTTAAGFGWTNGLFALALLLAGSELALGGFAFGKLAGAALLAAALAHPTFLWRRAPRRQGQTVLLLDCTDSMTGRAAALGALREKMPPGEPVRLTGHTTDLGGALLALTNRPVSQVILLSDGQHNRGVSPAWAAARAGFPVFTIAVGDTGPPAADRSIARLEATDLVFTGELAEVRATIAIGEGINPDDRWEAGIWEGGQRQFTTNISAGDISWKFQPDRTGLYVLRLPSDRGNPMADDIARQFRITVIMEKIRVFLEHDAPDWEFWHVRHALGRDPAVILVDRREDADVVFATTGQTWRWEAVGYGVFQRYWSDRVRREYLRARNIPRPVPVAVSEEPYRLWRNDDLLREVARVSGGAFFTAETVGDLPAALRAPQRRERRSFDLRDSWLALLAIGAAFTVSWVLRRPSSETA